MNGSRFYLTLAIVFALAAIAFLLFDPQLVGLWPILSAALSVGSVLRAWRLSRGGRAHVLVGLLVGLVLLGGAYLVHRPLTLTYTTTETLTGSEEVARELDALRREIEAEGGCQTFLSEDSLTGQTSVTFVTRSTRLTVTGETSLMRELCRIGRLPGG